MLSEQSSVGRILLAVSVLSRGIVSYVRVHFAKTQVQLPLDQKSSVPRVYRLNVLLNSSLQGEFAKTQVQLSLEQHSGIPRTYHLTC